MAFGFQRLTTDLLVNTTTHLGQFDPSITVLSDGRIVVVWQDNSDPSTNIDVRGQIFSAAGKTIGSEFVVTNPEFNQDQCSIASLANGGFVVSWTAHNGFAGAAAVNYQIYGANGAPAGIPLLTSLTSESAAASSISTLSNGNFVVAWTDTITVPNSVPHYQALFRVFLPDGTPASAAVVFEAAAANRGLPTVTSLDNGQFVVISPTLIGSAVSLRGQIFDAGGSPASADFQIGAGAAEPHEVSSTRLSNGGIVVTWTTVSFAGPATALVVHGQILDSGGGLIGGELILHANANARGGLASPEVTALADGRFVVCWDDSSGTLGDTSIFGLHAQIYLADGRKSGQEFLVNANRFAAQSSGQITAMPDGRFAIAFQDDSEAGGDNSGAAVRMQIFNPLTYAMSDGGESYLGGNFADIVYGGGGNDFAYGGDGADILSGLAGADTLDGGAGADFLYGGIGDDTFIVESAGDSVSEAGGGGMDTVRTTLTSYTLGADIENLQADTGAPFFGFGNSLANTLTGNSSGDGLFGGGGEDLLYGGGGGDALAAGNGNDTAYGGAGDDTLLLDDYAAPAASAGADTGYGDAGNDLLWGYGGNDILYGGDDNDTLVGNDFGVAVTGFDLLFGGAGNDQFFVGLGGNAYMDGGAGNDTFFGGALSDTLRGGLGSDYLFGSGGVDYFQFYAADIAAGDADIVYFIDAGEKLQFSASMLNTLYFQDLANLRYDSDPSHFTTGVYITEFLAGGQTAHITVYGTTVAALLPTVEYTL
jgi:Ca2+-binding RTX toxin-like protein